MLEDRRAHADVQGGAREPRSHGADPASLSYASTVGNYDVFETEGVPIKAWTRGVAIEDTARRQLENTARLPIIFRHVAVMPDVHFGMGATVGSVVPTEKAII